jgi:response regulator of citrate/malate metabolism
LRREGDHIKIKAAIIDDFKEQVDIVCEYISEFHKDIIPVGFYNPNQAKEAILKTCDFDIIITDHFMPYLEGDKLVGYLLKEYRPIIILITFLHDSEIIKRMKYYDYKVGKPMRFEDLNMVLNIVKRDIYISRDNKVNDKTEEILNNRCDLKQKSLFQKMIKVLLYDEEVKSRVYDTLSNQNDEKKSSIRRSLNNIIQNLDNNSFGKLGFVTRPKNIEFLSKFVDVVEKELIEEKKVSNK